MSVVRFLRRYSAESYFFLYNAAIVFIIPYLTILWKAEGMTGSQIGIMSAVRPFICSVSGQLLVGVADARRWHFSITVITYLITMTARSSMALLHGFIAHLLLVLASEACQSPFSIITDASIAGSTDATGYARARMLASLGWGALAPLSGWIVGQHGVPTSIAVYFGLVTAALVPTVLLPLRELGRKRSAGAEAPVPARSGGSKTAGGDLAQGSADMQLLPPSKGSSETLDERQHAGHAAELAIELLAAAWPPQDAAATAAEAAGDLLVQRIQHKLSLSRGGSLASAAAAAEAMPEVQLPPLLITAEEEAAEEEAATARAAAADAAAAQPADGWSIPSSPGGAPAGALLSPRPAAATPVGSYGMGGALARTTSAATTAFFSSCSDSSLSNVNFPRPSDFRPIPAQPRSALLAQLSGAPSVAAVLGGAGVGTTSAGTEFGSLPSSLPGSLPGSLPSSLPRHPLFRQPSDVASLATSAAYATPRAALPVLSPHPGRPPASSLFRQTSDVATGFTTPRAMLVAPAVGPAGGQQGSLYTQPSALSQALTGFDFSGHSGSALGGAGGGQQCGLLTQASNLSQALDGFNQSYLEGSVSAGANIKSPLSKSPLPAVAITVDCRSSLGGSALGGSMGGSGCGVDAPATAAAAPPADLSVWEGIKHMLRNPHHAAFFATALLMGIGYGALGYETLYLKESGAPGILLGMSLLVSTLAGELPVFWTQQYWLPYLGLETAFTIGMAGWIVRLGLYTLLPFMPNLWCVLPIEILQGLTFGVGYGIGTQRAKAIAPPHLRSTTQSMFFCLYYGVGPGISGLAGGYIYESLGMRFVFVIFTAVLAAGWTMILLALRWATRGKRAAARGRACRAAELPAL